MRDQNNGGEETKKASPNLLEKRIIALACLSFFPLLYLIGKLLIALLIH